MTAAGEGSVSAPGSEFARLLAEHQRFLDQFDRGSLHAQPLSGLAILTCMDARISLEDIFALRPGDANVIRNAGAVATDDALRSLVLSTQVLGADEVLVIGHTGCGLHDLDEAGLSSRLERATGVRSDVAFGTFHELEDHVRRQLSRIRAEPWIAARAVHGLIYDVSTGRLSEVS